MTEEKFKPFLWRENAHNPSVNPAVFLCDTLHLLAGASYLHLIYPYGIFITTIYRSFHKTLTSLDQTLRPICFPRTEEDCGKAASEFQKRRQSPLDMIVAEKDGIAIGIAQPSVRKVADHKKYYSRKNKFVLCVQAKVTAECKIVFLSACHTVSKYDSTALQATVLNRLLQSKRLLSWVVAGNDAYIKRNRLVTPWLGQKLIITKD